MGDIYDDVIESFEAGIMTLRIDEKHCVFELFEVKCYDIMVFCGMRELFNLPGPMLNIITYKGRHYIAKPPANETELSPKHFEDEEIRHQLGLFVMACKLCGTSIDGIKLNAVTNLPSLWNVGTIGQKEIIIPPELEDCVTQRTLDHFREIPFDMDTVRGIAFLEEAPLRHTKGKRTQFKLSIRPNVFAEIVQRNYILIIMPSMLEIFKGEEDSCSDCFQFPLTRAGYISRNSPKSHPAIEHKD